MADRYWVGGSGNWDATSTANWATSSGGTAGASAPTSADNVIFDAGSNVGTGSFTVTITGTSAAPAVCNDFSTGGAGGALDGAMTLTMGATAILECYGSMTLPASNFSFSVTSGAGLRFRSTSSGKTITPNGVSFGALIVVFNGIGGVWTLGSAITGTSNIQHQAGTFDTANYNVTAANIAITGTDSKTLTLGSSTVTLSASTAPVAFSYTGSNLTLNANTSTITFSGASPTFTGGGLTFYNVTFSNAAGGTTTINGANTFNDLTQTSRSASGPRTVQLGSSQTVQGTLTLGAANTAVRRIQVLSSALGTQQTITLNGTLATLSDVSFRDIKAAGTVATPWTGTRIGDGGNNTNITTDAPKTVYWNLSGTQNWSATGWATTNNGTPAVNNFPLPQDTATFTEAGSAGTVTIDGTWWIGSIQMADGVSNRTTAFTLATSTNNPIIFGNVTFFSSLTFSGTGIISFYGTSTQTITSAGITWTQSLLINAPSGTFKLADNLTNTGTSFTLTAGTLDLNSKTLTCVVFSSNNFNVRAIAFGTGNITVTGNNTTVWNTATVTGFSITGTPTLNFTYSGSTGTRTINVGALSETNSLSVNVSAGSDTVTSGSTNAGFRNLIFTGFSGSFTVNASYFIFGNLTISSGMTTPTTAFTLIFGATSGTQQITTNGKTLDFPLAFNGVGGTFAFQDALTQGSTRAFTLTNGTLQFKNGTTNVVGFFLTSGTNIKYLQSTSAGSQATISQASGAVTVTYLNIKDSNATGGVVWNASDSTNVDAGNNTGWLFAASGNFFLMFN